MHRNSIFAFLLLVVCSSGVAFGQSVDLNKLEQRALDHWKLAAAGERVKASNFIVATKREKYLNGGNAPFAEPKLVSFQFTADPKRVIVRVSFKSISADMSSQAPAVEQPWVWTNNNWYLDLPDAANVFRQSAPATDMNAATLREIEQKFRLKTTDISVGTVWEGYFPSFPIEFEYTGEAPIRIGTDPRFAFIGIDPPSSLYVRPGAKTLDLRIDSEKFEGPFSVPVRITIFYKDVSIERTVQVDGVVIHPIKISQSPDAIVAVPGAQFELTIKNTLDVAISLLEIQTFGLFDVLSNPSEIAANGEAKVQLAVRRLAPENDPQVRLQFVIPSRGLRDISLKIRTKPPQ